MVDYISRQAAIDAFLTELTKREQKNLLHTWSTVEVKYFVVDMLEKLPAAQSEHTCVKPAAVLPYSIDPDGTLTITVPKGMQVGRVLVQEDGTQWGGLFYAD